MRGNHPFQSFWHDDEAGSFRNWRDSHARSLYEGLYHRNGQFDADYGDMTVEDKLDIMESFVRVTPMPIRSSDMVFLCNCGDAYRNYGCEHSGVRSMLWNPDMEFPDVERSAKLKAKGAKTPSNPFAAVAKRKQKKVIGKGRTQSRVESRDSWKLYSCR